jgi:hypothetical protein
MADAQDLIDPATLAEALAAGGFALTAAQTAASAMFITDASKLICRTAGRYFALTAYDEVRQPLPGQPDKGEPDCVFLAYPPVQSVTRLAGGRTTALTVSNTDTATNQRATAAFAFTGDPEITVTRTGLTLTRVASGVATTGALAFAVYPTVAALAAAVVALGGGWSASVASGMGGWASADLYGDLAPQGCLSGTPGAAFDVFGTDLTGAGLDYARGVLSLPPAQGGYGAGPGAWRQWPGDVPPGGGYLPAVRCSYSGGWATVPEPVRRACAELVKYAFERVGTDGTLKTESAKDYSYAVREAWDAVPPWVRQVALGYKVYR